MTRRLLVASRGGGPSAGGVADQAVNIKLDENLPELVAELAKLGHDDDTARGGHLKGCADSEGCLVVATDHKVRVKRIT